MEDTLVQETLPENPAPANPERIDLGALSSTDRDNWRRTGELPKESPKEPPSVKQEAASEPAQQGKKQNASERLKEVLEDLKKAGLSPSELKTFKREAQAKPPEIKAEAVPPKPEVKAEENPKPKPADVDKDGKPKYKTWEEFENARDEWLTAEAERKFTEKQRKEAQEKAQRERDQTLAKTWGEKVAEAKKTIPDLDTVLGNHPVHQHIKPGSELEQFIMESPAGPQLIHHLANHMDEFQSILQMPTRSQAYRALVALEGKFATSEKPAPVPPPPALPKPVKEVGGRGTTPDDPLEAAMQSSGGKLTSAVKAAAMRQYSARQR